MRVAIITPGIAIYSETFIASHIDWFKQSTVFYGGRFPKLYGDGRRIYPLPKGIFQRIMRFTLRTLARRSVRDEEENYLVKILKNKHTDIVLAEYGFTGVEVNNVCRKGNIPLVVHFHGHDAHQKKNIDEYGERYQGLGETAAAIIVVSRKMEASLIKLGVKESKIRYIPYGIDTSLFQPSSQIQTAPVFLCVGRMTDKKAPYLTIMAFAMVVKVVPEAQLIMIGDGYLEEASRNVAEVLGIASNVDFTGPLSQNEIATLMGTARAYVQHSIEPKYGPTLGDSEGMPLSILEAGASGIPVISTRHAGIGESVIHGKTGYLVEERDVAGMSEYMIFLAQKPQHALELGKAARSHIVNNYSREMQLKKLEAVLDQACCH